MKIKWLGLVCVLFAWIFSAALFSGCSSAAAPDWQSGDYQWKAGLFGGAYLQVAPGELIIDLQVEIRGRQGTEESIRLILAAPDRKVLVDTLISVMTPSDSIPSCFTGNALLKTRVSHRGIYSLAIINTNDRYGVQTAWSMRTNAEAYVLETATGHRDERHMEPIVLLDNKQPFEIGFLPVREAFSFEVEGLDPEAEVVTLINEKGEVVAAIPVEPKKVTETRKYLHGGRHLEAEGSVEYTVPDDVDRGDGLWRLQIPRGNAYVNIDGVTRWSRNDRYEHLSVWSPVPDAAFPFLENRWMITPYQRHTWEKPGASGTISYTIHNNAPVQRTIKLSLEYPGEKWPVRLSKKELTLAAGASAPVEVAYELPRSDQAWECYVRATPADDKKASTYASLTVHAGDDPAAKALNLPMVLTPYSHENEQFGYLPDYPVDNQLYFDLENNPFVVSSGTLYRQEAGAWIAAELNEAVVQSAPGTEINGRWSIILSKIAFDADNDLYLLGSSGGEVALLRSADRGKTFTAWSIPGGTRGGASGWDIEQFSGHNIPVGPPPVIRYTRVLEDDADLPVARRDSRVRWRRVNNLDLIIGEKHPDGSVRFEEPMLLTSMALGSSLHSGIPSSVVSNGSKVHVVWGEATDPSVGSDVIPGVPAYVATYDRSSKQLKAPVFMSYGPPANDAHNTPSITMDSKGYLHIMVGTHGRPFQYLQSVEPNNAYGGWTEATRTSENPLGQTYVGLVCTDDDALHVVFRLWHSDEQYLHGKRFAALAYQRKQPGKAWEDPKLLVVPPLENYSIYYHRLTVDRQGDLVLSYDYWSTLWFYRNDQRGAVPAGSGRPGAGWGRAVLTSSDCGETWRLK